MVNARLWSQLRKVSAAGSYMGSRVLVENVTRTLDVQSLTLHPGFEACGLNTHVLQIAICTSDRSIDLSRTADAFRAKIIYYSELNT